MSTSRSSDAMNQRRKPQEFHLPDGRKVIVALPEDAATLKQRYDALPDTQAEVILHGSDEHHTYLAQSRDHHEKRRQTLREKHGPAFDEWESVQQQLDAVTEALDKLSDQTSALSANFSKFGFNATLRTYDDKEGGQTPAKGSRNSSEASTLMDWSDRNSGESIKLFRRPIIKQYFHKGLIWRASEETEVMSFELFFDLLYVGIIHINGEHVAEGADGKELLRFVVAFCMSWKVWTDVTNFISWFKTDDVLQRVEILFGFACLLGLTTNMIQSFADDPAHNTYEMMVAFYLAACLSQAFYCILTAFMLPLVKGVMISQAILLVAPTPLWIASIHVPMPGRLGLLFPALVLDLFGQGIIVGLFKYSWTHDTSMGRRLARWFDFFPATNIEHKVHRINDFIALVFGYSVISVLYQNYSSFGINAFLGKSILGLCQAFIFNWLYFDVDGSNIHVHAIRRSTYTSSLWNYAHLPFIMGYILAAAALSMLVVATDAPNTDAHDLTHHYEERSEPEVSEGIRYFYCSGLAIALLFMGLISASHDHKIPPGMRIPKSWRLANRAAVCAIILLLPLAREGLNSLELIATTLGLVTWVLLLETWGKSCKSDSFWPEECRTKYAARCSRKELEVAINGEKAVADVTV